MACGCDLGFGWLASQPASKPVGHTLHSSHAGHAITNPEITPARANLSGTLGWELNVEHRRRFNDIFDQAQSAYTFAKPPTFTDMVRSSAKWVDAHVPAHDTGEIAANGLEGAARSFYSYGSSFVHGYKWITDYAHNGTAFSLLADALAVSLNMTECAVCLFEAASRAPGGARPAESYVPERFEPTIAAWSQELFGA